MAKQDKSDKDPFKECLAAIYAGDRTALQDLIAAHPQSEEALGQLLITAAEEGEFDILRMLVELGADIDESGAMDLAASEGQMEAVQWFLDRGARVDSIVNGLPKSFALEAAAEEGHLDIVKLLIERGGHFDSETLDVAEDEVREYLETLQPRKPLELRREAGLMTGTSAAKLPGETPYLAAVVDHLDDDSLKLKYADWLETQKDPRGAFLRKFVAASKSMKLADFPKAGTLPEDWLRMIGYELVKEIAEHQLVRHKEKILRLTRPAILQVETEAEDEELPLGVSKLGGLPDLPPGVAWPRGVDCTAWYEGTESDELCGFAGQINLADLAGTLVGRLLPSQGLLSFFIFYDYDYSDDGVRVLFHPDVANLRRVSPPGPLSEASEVQPAVALSFEEGLDVPDKNGPWKSELALPANNEYEFLPSASDGRYGPLFCYPFGEGVETTDDKDQLHLITLEPSVRFYIEIHKDDLKARNFDKVKLAWIDFD